MSEIEITDDWLSGAEVEARVEIRSGRHAGTLAPCDVLALISAHRATLERIAEMEAKASKFDQTDGMDGAACAAIRDVLKEFGAPPAAFIDDASAGPPSGTHPDLDDDIPF